MPLTNNLDIKKNFFTKDYYAVEDNNIVKKRLNIFQRIVRKIFGFYKKTHLENFIIDYNKIKHALTPETEKKIQDFLDRINRINEVVLPIIENINDPFEEPRLGNEKPKMEDEEPRTEENAPIIEVVISNDEFVYDFVEQFLTPYLKGEITKETDLPDRTPMIESLYDRMPALNPEEKKKIETLALNAYFTIAAETAVRNEQKMNGQFTPLNHESRNFQQLVNALAEALPKDFPDLNISEEDILQRAQDSVEAVNTFRNQTFSHTNGIAHMDKEEEGFYQKIQELTILRLSVFKKNKELFLEGKKEVVETEKQLRFLKVKNHNKKLTKRLTPEKFNNEAIDLIAPIKISAEIKIELMDHYKIINLDLDSLLKILVDEILDFETLLAKEKGNIENVEYYEKIILEEREYLNTLIEKYREMKIKKGADKENLTIIENHEELYVRLNSKYTIEKIKQRYEKKLNSVLDKRGLRKAGKSIDSPLLKDVKKKAKNLANYVKNHRIERIGVIQARMEEKLKRNASQSEVDAKIYGLSLRTYLDIYLNELSDDARSPKWAYALPDYKKGVPTPHCKLLGDNQIFYSHYYRKSSDSYDSIYMVGKQLGSGNFNTAYEVFVLDDQHSDTSVLRQMKGNDSYSLANEWDNEAKIHRKLMKLKIPGILPYSYVIRQFTPENGHQRAMITREKCDGDLKKVQSGQLEETQRVSAMKQVLRTIRKMHAFGYAHGDLKPDNILYKIKKGEIKTFVADFGATKKIGDLRGASDLFYMRYDQMENYFANEKNDIWALALTAFKLKYDENHWFSKEHQDIATQVVGLINDNNYFEEWVHFILENPHNYSSRLNQKCLYYFDAKKWQQPFDTAELKNCIVQEVYGPRLNKIVAKLREELRDSEDSIDKIIHYLMDPKREKIKFSETKRILDNKN